MATHSLISHTQPHPDQRRSPFREYTIASSNAAQQQHDVPSGKSLSTQRHQSCYWANTQLPTDKNFVGTACPYSTQHTSKYLSQPSLRLGISKNMSCPVLGLGSQYDWLDHYAYRNTWGLRDPLWLGRQAVHTLARHVAEH